MRKSTKSSVNYDKISREIFLENVVNRAFEILSAEGIHVQVTENDISLGNRVWTSAWGKCYRRHTMFGGDRFEITLNYAFYKAAKPQAAVQTLLHELLHTLPGCFNHGGLWKRYAQMINKKYNLKIKRCSNPKEFGINLSQLTARAR